MTDLMEEVKDDGINSVTFTDIGVKVPFDGYLLENLKLIRRMVHNDRDCVIIVSGDSGAGKSVFAMQIAKYLDPTFNTDKVYFNGQKLITRLVSPDTKKYEAFIYDEAREGLSNRNSMSKMNKLITDCFAEIRQKNLFVLLLIPDYFDLDMNLAHHRSRYLFYVYEKPNEKLGERGDPLERGYFRFYSRRSKIRLYIKGKKFHDIDSEKADFHGRFSNIYVVDEENYRELKYNALRTNRNLDEYSHAPDERFRKFVVNLKSIRPDVTNIQLAKAAGVAESTVYGWYSTIEAEDDLL
jgi:hypothetical protein